MADGAVAGPALADRLRDEPELKDYHLLPSIRGDFLFKLGRYEEARRSFEQAASLAGNKREQEFLRRRAAEAIAAGARSIVNCDTGWVTPPSRRGFGSRHTRLARLR
jgi:hypothetical protein